ncbi:unnamed protein product, partial [Adineta steineri]
SVDVSSVKPSFSAENLGNQPSSFIESSSSSTRTSTNSFNPNPSHIFLQRSDRTSGHKKQNSLPESAVLQIINVAVPTAPPPAAVSSPLQQIKRRLHPGRSETYELSKISELFN